MAKNIQLGALEKQLKKEIGAYLKAANEQKKIAILDTLHFLGTPLTEDGTIIGDTSGLGSPTWSGNYQYNHRIMVNGDVEPAEIEESANPQYPVTLDPDELVEREAPKLKRTKFTDDISIVNDTPWSELIEDFGTKLIPEGGFYHRAGQYLDERLKSRLGQVVTVSPRSGDEDWGV